MAFQFGVFEVDPWTGKLRKHGVRIKLQEQPFKILLCLQENAGQVVTREQIQQKLSGRTRPMWITRTPSIAPSGNCGRLSTTTPKARDSSRLSHGADTVSWPQ